MALVKLKDPGTPAAPVTVDYTHNWNDGYLDTSSPAETILTSSWTIEPAAPSPVAGEMTVSSDSNTTTTATASFVGGLAGKVYRAINHVTTSGGREDERTIVIRVEER